MFLGIITYLDTSKVFKTAYSAFYDIDTITIAFLDETRYHDYRQQNRAVSNGYWRTQWSHNNGYIGYPLRVLQLMFV